MARPPTFDVELVRSEPLSHRVKSLRFRRVDGEPIVFDAGQWISLALPLETGEVRRAYSIASEPAGSSEFDLAVTLVDNGPGSPFLHALPVGSHLTAIGPQGFFTRTRELGQPALFIATGTGVTPLRSMILDAARRGEKTPQWLLFGLRTERDIIYRAELEELARTHSWFRFLPTLSQGTDDWAGLRGYVQTHVAHLWKELEAEGKAAPHTFICGLHEMVGSVRDLLRKEMQVPREFVHSERYD